MKNDRLTTTDIKQWIDNDEGLYNWWRSEGGSKDAFISANRAELERCITSVRDGDKQAHFLAYGPDAR